MPCLEKNCRWRCVPSYLAAKEYIALETNIDAIVLRPRRYVILAGTLHSRTSSPLAAAPPPLSARPITSCTAWCSGKMRGGRGACIIWSWTVPPACNIFGYYCLIFLSLITIHEGQSVGATWPSTLGSNTFCVGWTSAGRKATGFQLWLQPRKQRGKRREQKKRKQSAEPRPRPKLRQFILSNCSSNQKVITRTRLFSISWRGQKDGNGQKEPGETWSPYKRNSGTGIVGMRFHGVNIKRVIFFKTSSNQVAR